MWLFTKITINLLIGTLNIVHNTCNDSTNNKLLLDLYSIHINRQNQYLILSIHYVIQADFSVNL